jgi:hypothetical protein
MVKVIVHYAPIVRRRKADLSPAELHPNKREGGAFSGTPIRRFVMTKIIDSTAQLKLRPFKNHPKPTF